MRKFLVSIVLLLMASTLACAEDAFTKQIALGRDRAGMTWYLTDYGTDSSGLYAIARKYYTNDDGKASAVEMLTSRYSIPPRRAANLYFVEYRYEYTPDEIRYAEAYRKYYDLLGNELFSIEFDDSSSPMRKVFINVTKNTIQSKGLAYAVGRLKK